MDFPAVSGGMLSHALVQKLLGTGHIFGAFSNAITHASLPLHSTREIYRLQARAIPQKGERIRHLLRVTSALELPPGSPLETSGLYLIRLRETLVLPSGIFCAFSLSHTVNFFRSLELFFDGSSSLNQSPAGYTGELWALVQPEQGPIILSDEISLGHLFFFSSFSSLPLGEVLRAHHDTPLFTDHEYHPLLPDLSPTHTFILTLALSNTTSVAQNSRAILSSQEHLHLPQFFSGRILRDGKGVTFLPPGFGADTEQGKPITLSFFPTQHTLFRANEPLCEMELLPVAQEISPAQTLYTSPHEETGKTE
jgi:hypothetical protein